MIARIAKLLDAPEEGLWMLLSIWALIPIGHLYNLHIVKRPRRERHLFIATSGIALLFFNCGWASLHLIFSAFACWGILWAFQGTSESVLLAHLVFMGHLLLGYFWTATENYDISWTTPYCVMVLRWIGMIVDIYDGKRIDQLRPEQKRDAITQVPDLLEIFAFGFNYATLLVGPQVQFNRFRSWANGEYLDKENQHRKSRIPVAMNRFVMGLVYAVLHVSGNAYLPASYLNAPEFYEHSYFWRYTLCVLWTRSTLSKYIAMFLFAEAGCIYSGLAYNGMDKRKKNDRWDGCQNVDVWLWETGTDFNSMVLAFNRLTNHWMKHYVFRRLRWIGNKQVSHILTLAYLAIWHGFHLGYFLFFGFEFAVMHVQNEFYSLIERTPTLRRHYNEILVYPIRKALGRIVILYTLAFGILTFGLVSCKYWIKPVSSLYFLPYIFYFGIGPAFFYLIKPAGKTPKIDQNGNIMKTDSLLNCSALPTSKSATSLSTTSKSALNLSTTSVSRDLPTTRATKKDK